MSLRTKIIQLLTEMDGMALDYEFDKFAALYSIEELGDTLAELINSGWIYVVRRRE